LQASDRRAGGVSLRLLAANRLHVQKGIQAVSERIEAGLARQDIAAKTFAFPAAALDCRNCPPSRRHCFRCQNGRLHADGVGGRLPDRRMACGCSFPRNRP